MADRLQLLFFSLFKVVRRLLHKFFSEEFMYCAYFNLYSPWDQIIISSPQYKWAWCISCVPKANKIMSLQSSRRSTKIFCYIIIWKSYRLFIFKLSYKLLFSKTVSNKSYLIVLVLFNGENFAILSWWGVRYYF